MIRSITQAKPEEEIERLLDGMNQVFIIGCGTCVTLTATGGARKSKPWRNPVRQGQSSSPARWWCPWPATT
jgi:hypothetical protein